ncbi:MAG: hypothetical protein ACI9MC_002374 [Kiritimatiellia bacterium]
MQGVIGELASIQILREVASRYPQVRPVEEVLYDLPDRVMALDVQSVPTEARQAGVTQTDIRLMSAEWTREFLALNPRSDLAPLAGLRLATTLMQLGADERAAGWAHRLAAGHPNHELVDRLLYVEGLARSNVGESRRARARLRRVANEVFQPEERAAAPSSMAEDAGLALARIREARGDRAGAKARYRALSGTFDEARASADHLQTQVLRAADIVVVRGSDPIRLDLTVAGVSQIAVRAYALDMRTLFLRDGGVQGAQEVNVSGVAPVWSGTRSVHELPFERPASMTVPVNGPGAYLLQIEAGGQRATVLAVRTDLEIDANDAGGMRRLTVRLRGRAVPNVEVRALADELVVTRTDARGVAVVPAFAPSFVFAGAHVAFTRAGDGKVGSGDAEDELQRRLQAEVLRLSNATRQRLQYVRRRGQRGVVLSGL